MTKNRKPSKKVLFSIIGAVVLIGIVISVILYNSRSSESSDANTPPFQSLLPANTSISELGGWKKLSPPNGDDYYVYIDELDGTLIRISQQQLPDSFKDSVDTKVAEVAKGYGATRTFDANGIKVHSGESAQGQQSIIFTKDNLLVLIFSDAKIQDESWIAYITSLS